MQTLKNSLMNLYMAFYSSSFHWTKKQTKQAHLSFLKKFKAIQIFKVSLICFFIILFCSSCAHIALKPQYIDNEGDLVQNIDSLFEKIQKNPQPKDLKSLLNLYHLYYLRISKKIDLNNKLALQF